MNDFQDILKRLVESDDPAAAAPSEEPQNMDPASQQNPYTGMTDPGAAVQEYMKHHAEKVHILQTTVESELAKLEKTLSEIGQYKVKSPGFKGLEPAKALPTATKPVTPGSTMDRLAAARAAAAARKPAAATPPAPEAGGTK